MPGLIQSQQAAQVGDGILSQTIQAIRAKVPPQMMDEYMRIIVAGKRVMYSPQTRQYMWKFLHDTSQPLFQAVATGIATLMGVIYKGSGNRMGIPAAVLASVELMCDALDVGEKTMGLKVTPDVLAACTHATQIAVLQKFGIGQAAIDRVVQMGQQAQQGGH